MGGGSKKQKVGNRYEAGFAMVLCRQADALLAVRANDEVTLFEGSQGQGTASIHDMGAFGGDEREGGFSGDVDVQLGGNDQAINPYLQAVLGDLVSGLRGVVSAIYKRPYVSANTARLPVLAHKMLNVSGIHRGWMPELCIVTNTISVRSASIYVALDMSNSMTSGRISSQSTAVAAFIRSLKGKINNVRVLIHADVEIDAIERLDCTDDDYEDIAVWIEALSAADQQAGGDWDNAVGGAGAFFARAEAVVREFPVPGIANAIQVFTGSSGGLSQRTYDRIVIFTTDGAPSPTSSAADASATLSLVGNVSIYVFNIDDSDTSFSEILDNTPSDGVPVVSGGDASQLLAALSGAFTSWADVNPIHLIRCLLTDPMRGGTVLDADIGDSYAIAAQTFFDRGFGLSPKFRGVDQVIADRQEIERHCDCVSYRSTATGKWEIKIIDEPFTVGDLTVLDSSIVMDWSDLSRPEQTEIPNQLTVTYTNRRNGDVASVTRTNVAGVRRQGRVIKAEAAKYPAITREDLATQICLRDVRSISKRLLGGVLPLTYLPEGTEIGTRFLLNEPALRINNVVVVVSEIRHGDSTDAGVWVTISEDKYAAPTVIPETDLSVVETNGVLPVDNRVVTETGYYQAVLFAGQTAVDDELVGEPDLGRLVATGAAPNGSHLDFTIGIDAGAGIEDAGVADFEPYGVLITALTDRANDLTFRVSSNATLGDIGDGDIARLGDEIIRIDSVAIVDDEIEMTVGRGCLDTTPKNAGIGDVFVVIQNALPLEADYIAPQSLDIRLISRTSQQQLSIAEAPEDTIVFDSRAIRPYAPGRFQANGSYTDDTYYADIVLSWVHRDRTLQTTPNIEDHTFASIGPEAGTTYRMVVDALDDGRVLISNLLDSDLGLVTSYDWNDATVLPAGTDFLRFRVYAVRDGYDSWQPAEIILRTFDLQPPANITLEEL